MIAVREIAEQLAQHAEDVAKETFTMVDADYVRRALRYDPATGEFFWLERGDVGPQWNARYAGKQAGRINQFGYRGISINDQRYQAHRLAWLYITGSWPRDQIDHINRCRDDNRFTNLREATTQENHQNLGVRCSNKSGFPGVCWHMASGKWAARIRVGDGRRIYLGLFESPERAFAAYQSAKSEMHGFHPLVQGVK